jgi:hypothetical protein
MQRTSFSAEPIEAPCRTIGRVTKPESNPIDRTLQSPNDGPPVPPDRRFQDEALRTGRSAGSSDSRERWGLIKTPTDRRLQSPKDGPLCLQTCACSIGRPGRGEAPGRTSAGAMEVGLNEIMTYKMNYVDPSASVP